MTTKGVTKIYVGPPRGVGQHDIRLVIRAANRLGLEGREITSVEFEEGGSSVTAKISYVVREPKDEDKEREE